MATPVGGPSQLLVKCRNNNASLDISQGDAVSLVGTLKDTDTGENILLVEIQTIANDNKFLGIALADARASTDSDAIATGKGAYLNVCIYGQVEAKCYSGAGGGSGIVTEPGMGLVAALRHAGATGILGADIGATNTGAAGITVAMALQTGAWNTTGGSTGSGARTFIFLNGIGRHAHGGS